MIKFVSDLRQVGGFLWVLRFLKTTKTEYHDITEILLKVHNSIDLVVSDKKIFKISANENTLWTLAAMLDFKSAPKTQIW